MPVLLACPGCGRRLKVKDDLVGRAIRCPHCRQKFRAPEAKPEAGGYAVQRERPRPAVLLNPEEETDYDRQIEEKTERPSPPPRRTRKVAIDIPPSELQTASWVRHLHWLLALALLPLAISLLHKDADEANLLKRLAETVKEAPADVQQRTERVITGLEEGKGAVNDLFDALPNHRLSGALLPRRTLMHWAFALIAAILYLAFIVLLSADGSAEVHHVLGIGLFTATIGILFLFLVQLIAAATQGYWVTGRGIVVILFYIVKFIGYSYRAAEDPENGFALSLMGFTLGVGLCEEVCKALPLLWYYRRGSNQNWRGAFLWGLASGAGFGVAEAIIYSSDFYNGISGASSYGVRFTSCIALHAVWTGSVAIMMHLRQDLIQENDMALHDFIWPMLYYVGIPMVLHGLYDTLLKKDINVGALIVAVLSFLFLAFLISRLHTADEAAARRMRRRAKGRAARLREADA
ncbi:MAG TPA: PrsW family glutamic-type intramembrane protease [Gemmataceae bacterium]|nr:PrsW family glutamic-type intramembrane protease [Gemmataceae bacterium]